MRVLGLVGIVAVMFPNAVKDHEGKLLISGILSMPFKPLVLLNVIWIMNIPTLLMNILYLPVGVIVYLLNLVHAFVLQRNNEELNTFLIRMVNSRLKLTIALSGLTDVVPHLDLYASERGGFPVSYAVKPAERMPRFWVALRLLGVSGIILVPHMIIMFFLMIAYSVVLLVQWIIISATGHPNAALQSFINHVWRVGPMLESFAFGLRNEIPNPLLLIPNKSDELETTGGGSGWIQGAGGAKVSMNLLVLLLLLICSGGIYGFFWLARVARLMGDDPFTTILVSGLGLTLPLSFIYSRYYRRSETLQRMHPSVLVELFVMIPLLNGIMGPFVIQYNLNNYERMRAKGDGSS
ncbi:MAG: DUF4389 domain-containing protein [Spirochaetia bacterium]|nr:DUF4389 domain-containing protein [Spirochaetia bacterium]